MSLGPRSVGRLLERGTTKLFVCDMQERFRSLILDMPKVISSTKLLVETANLLNIQCVVTEQYPKALKHTIDELKSVLDASALVVEKKKFSMMTSDVENALCPPGEKETTSVILCGIEAHVCILQTTLDLLDRGIDVHIVTDAVSSQREEDVCFIFFQIPIFFRTKFC
eukprot:GSMAST32.ASY1.ANO1.2755.1 assembled CDS